MIFNILLTILSCGERDLFPSILSRFYGMALVVSPALHIIGFCYRFILVSITGASWLDKGQEKEETSISPRTVKYWIEVSNNNMPQLILCTCTIWAIKYSCSRRFYLDFTLLIGFILVRLVLFYLFLTLSY